MQALNDELGKIKKNSNSHKEIVDLLDMSASFIDDPKVKEEPEFFKKYVRSNSNLEPAALI